MMRFSQIWVTALFFLVLAGGSAAFSADEIFTHQVDVIYGRKPGLALTMDVFTPKEKKGYYLVALGGRMTRDEAVRIQRLARADRVARDVYIQNYSE